MDFLKEHLGDELYAKVSEKLKGNDKVKLANLASGEYIGKDKFTTAENAKKELEGQLQERDTQLEALKKTAGDNETLKAEIAKLQADNKTATDKYAADLKDLTLTNAIKLAVAGKVHDETLVTGLVDKTKLVIDGEKVVGLDDQLKTLQESKAFLFKEGSGDGGSGTGGGAGFQKVGTDGKGTGQLGDDQLASIFGNTTKE